MRRPIKQRLCADPGNAKRDLINERQVMGRAYISPTFCVITVDADCYLAHRQTELARHNDARRVIVGLHRHMSSSSPLRQAIVGLTYRTAYGPTRIFQCRRESPLLG